MTGEIEAILETGSIAAVEIAASALAGRGEKTAACANCAHSLVGPYCAICGQPTKTRRRSIRHLLGDFFVDLVNFDSRILRTARALLLEPGELPRAFRQGRTQPYVPSIRLYLFVSLIFFVLLSITNIAILQLQVVATPAKIVWVNGKPFMANPAYDKDDSDNAVTGIKPLIPISMQKATRPGGVFEYSTQPHFFSRIGSFHSNLSKLALARLMDSVSFKVDHKGKDEGDWMQRNVFGTMNRLAADPAALNGPMTTWMPRALFLLLPLYALLLALFHIRRRKDFFLVDHLVFSLSVHTVAFVALIAAMGLAQIIPGEWVAWTIFAALSIYIFIAMKRFYEQGWFLTTVKFLFISGIYTIFFLLPGLAAVLALSVFGGNLG
jgi:hypothetical protein